MLLFHEPDPGRSYQELLAAAESGDADAACKLYMLLMACLDVPTGKAEFQEPPNAISEVDTDTAYLMRAREFKLSVPADQATEAAISGWLQRAAEGGNVYAMANTLWRYGSLGNPKLTPATLDEQTKRYVLLLDAAALGGMVLAVAAMSNFYLGGYLVERSATTAYAYFAAESQLSAGAHLEPEQWYRRNSSLPFANFAELNDEEIGEAKRLKDEIVLRAKK